MNERLKRAIDYRKDGKLKQSNEMMLALVDEFPNDAFIHYQCAWSFDVLGEERKAVPFYEKSIALGLPHEHLEGALLGLGSTYRTLGEYEKSKAVFQRGVEAFPNNKAMQTFFAMTLYNLNEHTEAMERLLNCLIETTNDKQLLQYKKALQFYSDKLDEVWD